MTKGERASNDADRRDLAGYTAAEFDREFVRAEHSDAYTVAIRALTLTVVYALMARAIVRGDLTPALLLLPIAVDLVATFWIGYAMSRWLVDCPAFTTSAGSFKLAFFWTLAIAGVIAARLAYDPAQNGLDPDVLVPHLVDSWNRIRASWLHYAMAAMLIGLIASTIPEVLRWRRVGGVFVWTSIMQSGFRLGVMFLMVMICVAFGVLFADWIDGAGPSSWVWATFAFLVTADMLTLVLSTLMHRDLKKKAATKPPL